MHILSVVCKLPYSTLMPSWYKDQLSRYFCGLVPGTQLFTVKCFL